MLAAVTLAIVSGLVEPLLSGVDPWGIVAQNTTDAGAFSCYVNVDSPSGLVGCAVGEYRGPVGDGLFGLIIGGGMLLSLYVASDGDLAVPAVITTLFGGALVPMLPGTYQGIAIAIMLIGLIGSLFAAGVKYVARGGM